MSVPNCRVNLGVTKDSSGDHRFDELYRRCFGDIYAYVLRRRSPAETPDIVANVFTTAWRRLRDLPPPPEDRLWLFKVARLTIAQQQRAERRRIRLLLKLKHTNNMSGGSMTHDGTSSSVIQAFNCLRSADQELVRLIVWEGLSHAEVGFVLNCSANAVALRWRRVAKRLRGDLSEFAPKRSALRLYQINSIRTKGGTYET